MPYLSLVAGGLPLSRYGTSFRNLVRMPDKMSLDGALIIARFYPHLLLGMRIARQHGLRPIVLEPGPARLSFPSFLHCRTTLRACDNRMGKRYRAAYYNSSQ